MASGKTIDDLGVDASKQYAAADLGKGELKDASLVTTQTQKDQNTPVSQSQLSLVLQTEVKNQPFADTAPPPGYESMTNQAFMHQFVPSLGDGDKLRASIHRLEKYISELKERLENQSLEAAQINLIENEIIFAENILDLLKLILEMSKLKGTIEGTRRSSQKG